MIIRNMIVQNRTEQNRTEQNRTEQAISLSFLNKDSYSYIKVAL